jgi:hypothetical protein
MTQTKPQGEIAAYGYPKSGDGESCEAKSEVNSASSIEFGTILPAKRKLTRRERIAQHPLQGFSFLTLYRVFKENQFQWDQQYTGKVLYLWVVAAIQTILSSYENRLFAEQIATTQIKSPPIFILGHWRNGTTFLHNLLCQDPNHAFPQTYQAFFPGSFLLPLVKKLVPLMAKKIILETRTMDNVKFGPYEPWEDEFIMATLTGISPYIRVLFPRTQGREAKYEYPDFKSEIEVSEWKKGFRKLLKRLTVLESKRLVLKSPPHTTRVKILLELFPEAKFIHIVRHPYDVFPSNLRVWRDAFARSFLQTVNENEIIEMILSTYEQVYQLYHAQKSLIPERNLVEIKFEGLEKDPLEHLRLIYQHLDLPDFSVLAERARQYLQGLGEYRKNVFHMTPDLKMTLRDRWAQTFQLYNYSG